MPLSPGSKLGPYEVLSLLGSGGMGEVYRARDPRLGRDVAIKVLHADRMADENRRRRFVQEAQAASSLNHPNIVTIHEIDAVDGIDFIVMEYVSGKSLDALIPRQGMRLSEVLKTAIPMADALTRAHAKGIVHRDLKPANVMVSNEGVVKVLDFGMAKLVSQEEPSDDGDTQTRDGADPGPLSRAGTIAGTAGYMSPEQATGGKVDSRSDVFAMGAVLYEMATGRRAFGGNSQRDTLAAVIKEQPKAPSLVAPSVPRDLEKVILRCLQKDVERRFQHMQDLRIELQEIKEESESGPVAAVTPARRTRRYWLAAGIAIALAVAAPKVWQLVKHLLIPAPPLPPPRLVQLTALRGMERNPTFSLDGEQFAFAWQGEKQDNWDIYLKMVDSPEVRRLTTDPAPDVAPSWSPDGRQIAYLRNASDQGPAAIHVISPLGGSDRKLSDFPAAASPFGVIALSWTPDGRGLAVTGFDPGTKPERRGIFLVPADGGEPRALTSPKPGETHGNAAFSPDGHSLAYLSCLTWFQCQMEVADIGPDFVPSGSPRVLGARDKAWTGHPAWTGDSRSIVVGNNGDDMLWRVWVAGDRPPERIEVAGQRASFPVIFRNRIAFQRNLEHQDLYRLEPGRAPQPVLASSVADCCSDFSPDGRKVAFASTRSSKGGIWLADADFSSSAQLTSTGGGSPRWSPDGRKIAFDIGDADQRYHVWTIDADGVSPRQLTKGPGDENQPSWSRDSSRIYFVATRDGSTDIWRIPAAGGAEERLTHDGAEVAFESVDGKTLFVGRHLPGKEAGVFAVPLGGGPERPLVDCETAFAVGSEGVYYFGCRADATGTPLYLLDPATGRNRLLARLERATGGRHGLTVSRDGKTILYTRQVGEGSDLMMIENFQ